MLGKAANNLFDPLQQTIVVYHWEILIVERLMEQCCYVNEHYSRQANEEPSVDLYNPAGDGECTQVPLLLSPRPGRLAWGTISFVEVDEVKKVRVEVG